jgi:hypothetical protein
VHFRENGHSWLVDIGPEEAQKLYEEMPYKRQVRQPKVAQFARAMAAGRWRRNGQVLITDDMGRLLDGMHRMLAVIASGKTVTFELAHGVDPEALSTIDAGTVRSFADTLLAVGGSDHPWQARYTAPAARLLWQFLRGDRWHQASAPDHQELLALANAHPRLGRLSDEARTLHRRISLSPTSLIVGLYLTEIDSGGKYGSFWEAVSDGVNLPSGDARLALRNVGPRIATRRQQTASARMTALALIIKAWNAYLSGENVHLLVFRKGETLPWPLNVNRATFNASPER